MSTQLMIEILSEEGFTFTDKECCVCYEKFINNICFYKLCTLYDNLLVKKYNIQSEDKFFGDNPVRCYNDRFECLSCRSVLCDTCIQNIQDENGATGDKEDIRCPICRTLDIRGRFTFNLLPTELLLNIKGLNK